MTYPRFLTTAPPTTAVSIEADRVMAVSVTRGPAGPVVVAHASEPLPRGAVVPALAASNVVDRQALVEALTRVVRRLEGRPRRVALVVPDMVGKVSIVRFGKVPGRAADLDQLVRFQVRKTAPFRIEEAQVTWTAGSPAADGSREFVTVLARRDVLAEYEAACAAVGVHAGLVDLATFNVINLVLADPARPQRDWLLVHVAADYATMAILRGPDLIFFRNRTDETNGNLAELVHQTAMYYEDRLGGTGFERVILAAAAAGGGDAAAAFHHSLEGRLGLAVTPLAPSAFARFQDRIHIDPALFASLAPLVGVLERQAGA